MVGPGDLTGGETRPWSHGFPLGWERQTSNPANKQTREVQLLIRAMEAIKQGDVEDGAWRVFVGWERSHVSRGWWEKPLGGDIRPKGSQEQEGASQGRICRERVPAEGMCETYTPRPWLLCSLCA